MNNPDILSADPIVEVVRAALERGARVDIDGLGSFLPDRGNGVEFVSQQQPRVFISYVHEDAQAAERLYKDLSTHGFDPWIDRCKLLPGQNWPRAIDDAISTSDFVIACFSTRSTTKRGGFQAELRYALDCARRMPLDSVFLIPVRLDECRIPNRIQDEVQYIDLSSSWEAGFLSILKTLQSNLPVRPDPTRPDYRT